MVQDTAVEFIPPQKGMNNATGLYCGDRDMFCFLVDPLGWCEIGGESFAPGFFVWNSEVGSRTVGIETFWFQQICANHIVWDATEVLSVSRKHTRNVGDGLTDIQSVLANLVNLRDERRDSFVKVLKKAMVERLGDDAEEVVKNLVKHGFGKGVAKAATQMAEESGNRFTIFSLVDALTRLSQQTTQYAGDRLDFDTMSGKLLQLAA